MTVAVARGERTTALLYEAAAATRAAADRPTLILAHGAGAGQRSAFIVAFARALATLGIDVVTFNFLYTEQHRRLPDRGPALEACYGAVVRAVGESLAGSGRPLFIGGKSMGGRIATQIAAADPTLPVDGLVLLGYPLHPPGRPAERRDAHLSRITRPMLFIQGGRDTFGTPAELGSALARITPPPALHVVEGGDHSFKVARAREATQTAVYDDVQRTIVEWMTGVTDTRARETRPRV